MFKIERFSSKLMLQLDIPKLGKNIRTAIKKFKITAKLKPWPNFTKTNSLIKLLQE